jgi:hypothetical protein
MLEKWLEKMIEKIAEKGLKMLLESDVEKIRN